MYGSIEIGLATNGAYTMDNNHLDLAHEFPEFKDKIYQLKTSDGHFRKLFENYGEVCKSIQRSEQRVDLLSEVEEEGLRRQRLRLKDELVTMLTR